MRRDKPESSHRQRNKSEQLSQKREHDLPPRVSVGGQVWQKAGESFYQAFAFPLGLSAVSSVPPEAPRQELGQPMTSASSGARATADRLLCFLALLGGEWSGLVCPGSSGSSENDSLHTITYSGQKVFSKTSHVSEVIYIYMKEYHRH
jgi:hypothetical protein